LSACKFELPLTPWTAGSFGRNNRDAALIMENLRIIFPGGLRRQLQGNALAWQAVIVSIDPPPAGGWDYMV